MVNVIWKGNFSWCNSCNLLLSQSTQYHVKSYLSGSINWI